MTPAEFRAAFPEFSNTTTYPDSAITFWSGLATKLLRPERWQDILDEGVMLFTAHNLSLERMAQAGGAAGGAPGLNGGIVASKSIDKLSISYNASIGIDPGDGHWALTTYGTRFLWLMRMAGTGGTQYGAGPAYGGPQGVWGGPFGIGWPYSG